MKLLESAKKKKKKSVDQITKGENVPKFETVEFILVYCHQVDQNFQQTPKVLFTFMPDKQFCQLITTAPHSLKMLKTAKVELQSTEVWFTDQNNRPLEIEDNVNITLIVGIR